MIVFRMATDNELNQWDDFVEESINGTLFHTRRFLSYHGDRFFGVDRWLIALRGGQVISQICYAVSQDVDGKTTAFSPYGASYGGLLVRRGFTYGIARDLILGLQQYLQEEQIHSLRITPPIACCAPVSLDVLSFAMLEHGFHSVNRDISSVIYLHPEKNVEEIISSRARRNARKAMVNGVTVKLGASADDFWKPMEATFARHNVTPTHNLQQLKYLQRTMPDRIRFDVAYRDNAPVAGVCLFMVNSRVACSFYLVQSQDGEEVQALTLVVQSCIEKCKRDGYYYFDMGTSSVGMKARENIFRFKEGFAAEGFFRETYEWSSP